MATPPGTPASRWPDRPRRVLTVETGHGDRLANMRAFTAAALTLLEESLR